MSTDSQRMLGHYRLVEKLGEGGMGVVWRAVDTTLDREVAVKILPEALREHPDRLERFEREAKLLASLNHPNIATLHGLHREGQEQFLVMELVDGEDLAQRLARGPLPTDDAMKLCAQITRALQAAHERGIVHRDLKPANVVLTSTGEAKVLDFGLAKVLEPDTRDEALTSLPTMTTGGTRIGTILGTAAYMSPEQARGKPTDRRTDIWSFGCVLHECLTGVSEFRGDTMSDSIGAILHKEPDWDALPADLPANVRWLLRRCLTKDRDNRLHDIADARIELEQAIVDPAAAGALPATTEAAPSRGLPAWSMGLAAVGLLLIGVVIGWMLLADEGNEAAPTIGLSLELPEPQRGLDYTLSPDGSAVVFRIVDAGSGEDNEDPPRRLWLRRLDTFVATPIPGTEGANSPRFSPDGRTVAYVVDGSRSTHNAELRVVGLDGRPPLTIATNAIDHATPFWLTADEIAYVEDENPNRVLAVSRGGGEAREIFEFGDEANFDGFRYEAIEQGRWILSNGFEAGRASALVYDTRTGAHAELLSNTQLTDVLEDGRVVFTRGNAILVAELDTSGSLPAIAGEIRTIMSGGTKSSDRLRDLAVSENGVLSFTTGAGARDDRQLMTIDAEGRIEPLLETPGSYLSPTAFSARGERLAVTMDSEDSPADTWVVELDTGARRPMAEGERVTFGGVWLPGDRLALTTWQSINSGRIVTREMRRNAEPVPLFDPWPEGLRLTSGGMSFDGHLLAFVAERDETNGTDIWAGPIDGSAEPRPLVATRASEDQPVFSPDGRWLAYSANDSGRYEVYLRRHGEDDDDGRVLQVSRRGGGHPAWSADGTQLYFRLDDSVYVVAVETQPTLRVGEPRVFIESMEALRFVEFFSQRPYAPTPDGRRLAFAQGPDEQTRTERIDVVLNWQKLLER